MNVLDFELQHNVKLIPKKDSWPMRLIGRVSKNHYNYFWITYRLPFGKPTISYPPYVIDPMQYMDILQHELVHVKDIRSAWGLFKAALFVSIFPLPVLFSGRWFIERPAYLHDIRTGRLTIEQSVEMLWTSYGFAWPKCLMRKWFQKQLEK